MKQQLTPDVPGKIEFNPVKIGSIVPQIERQKSRDADAASRYIQSQNESMETAKSNARQGIQAAKMYGEDWQKLAKFSKTLTDYFVEEKKKQNQSEMEEGIAMAYTEGVSMEQQQGLEDMESELRSNDSVTQAAGAQAFEQTNNYEVASRVKGLSGWRAYGHAIGKSQMAGAAYSTFIADAMESDNETQITVNGNTFTPSTARGSGEVQAAMATLRGNFIKQFGLAGMNPAILNKYAFPAMHRTDAQLATQYRGRFAEEESYEEQQEAKATFQADKDLGGLITRLSTTLDSNGKPLGNKGAHQMAQKYLTESIKAGTIDAEEARSLKDQTVPWDKKGRTFGTLYPNMVEGAIRDALAIDRADADIARREEDQRREEAGKELVQTIMQNPDNYTKEDIEGLQKEWLKEYGTPNQQLDLLARSYNATVTDIDNQRKQMEALRRVGMLRPHHVENAHPSLYNQFFSTAQQQENVASSAGKGNYKEQLTQIKKEVATARNDVTGDGSVGIVTGMIASELQSMFQAEVALQVAAGNPNAVADALAKTRAYFIQEGGTVEGAQANPNGRYTFLAGQKDNYLERLNDGAAIQGAKFTSKMQDIYDAYGKSGGPALKQAGLVFDEAELLEMEQTYGQPNWEIPTLAVHLGEKFGLDPYDIINAQREAVGLAPLPSVSAEIKKGMSPEGQKLLDRFRSQNRSTRAMAGEGLGWNPDMVKHGHIIDSAASSYGVEPAHIAALMEIESSGDANQVSYNGSSFGAMQINKAAHPTFFAGGDWRDPTYNIDYGAQYFSQLLQQFGDPKAAAMAYNAGPGNYQRWEAGQSIPKSVEQEMINHGKKFMKALSRYDKTALNQPLARRGQFEVAQVVSTDPRYQGDSDPTTLFDPAGHGGDAMHQHYEFTTKEQAGLAKALYESKGFRVTSYIRPDDHGSAHQHGYAIDVTPPLNLPYTDEAEIAWIDKANAVIGL